MILFLMIAYGSISLLIMIWIIMMISSYINFITVNAYSTIHPQLSDNKIQKRDQPKIENRIKRE